VPDAVLKFIGRSHARRDLSEAYLRLAQLRQVVLPALIVGRTSEDEPVQNLETRLELVGGNEIGAPQLGSEQLPRAAELTRKERFH
jgi:hypothetical protein